MEKHSECMALLLSGPSFESFYGEVMHLTCEQYLASYRNDFSFIYAYALARVGFKTVIYMPSWTCHGLHRIDEDVSVRFLPLASWFGPWQKFKSLSRTPIGRYVASFANVLAFARPLKEGLLEDRANVLYIQEYWTARFDYLARTSPVPVVGADHGNKRKRQLAMFKRKAFQKAAAITCQTEDECADVVHFGVKPVLLPNGVDVDFYSPSPGTARSQTVLTVARLTERQKRTSDLITAMQHLPPPWSLVIAGDGPDRATLTALVAELGLESRVTFLGFVKDKAVLRDLYSSAGVFSLPSVHEAMALVTLEAMSCECAVVVTSIRAFQALLEDKVNGYMVPVGRPAELAAAILEAWKERERIGAAARKRVVESYSLKAMASRLASILRNTNTLKPQPQLEEVCSKD